VSYEKKTDIYELVSNDRVAFEQISQSDLKGKDIPKTDEFLGLFYQQSQCTNLVFKLTGSATDIYLKIFYVNQLPLATAKHAFILFWTGTSWSRIVFTLNEKEHAFEIHTNKTGYYAVGIQKNWYSQITQSIANEWPHWAGIRSAISSGQIYLNQYAMIFEEIKEQIQWIREQKYLSTVDVHQLDWIYIYSLPVPLTADDTITLKDGDHLVEVFDSVYQFFVNDSNQGGIIDYEKSRFYSVAKYEQLKLYTNKGTFNLVGQPYQVWNSLDDFGLLLDEPRRFLEKNKDYIERLLNVFRYPSNTTKTGVANGVGRNLNLIQKVTWVDDTKTLFIRNDSAAYIEPHSIRVDGYKLDASDYTIDASLNLKINPMNQHKTHIVTFMNNLIQHELYNQQDMELQKLIYQDDGQATSTLLHWVEQINMIAPVMWDQIKWDQGFWDTINKNLLSIGYIPNIWDSNTDVWKSYVIKKDRWEAQNIWQTE
jgi:hypothetical protein